MRPSHVPQILACRVRLVTRRGNSTMNIQGASTQRRRRTRQPAEHSGTVDHARRVSDKRYAQGCLPGNTGWDFEEASGPFMKTKTVPLGMTCERRPRKRQPVPFMIRTEVPMETTVDGLALKDN